MTSGLSELAEGWSARLRELVAERDVPGAVLGVSHRGERVLATAGVCGIRNPAPVTVDTAFQLGSISKLYTATLLMMVAGSEILQRSVSELVPEAAWMEPEIRVIHLLTHSSGLGGDDFADAGRGDDCLARYVTRLAERPRDVPGPPGNHYSYCNSGYAVLGRLIEVLTEQSFDDALRTRLLGPLGAGATTTLPEQTILGPAATGHNRDGDGPLTADAQWNFARACGPLGGLCATAGDVLSFAQLHLDDGRASTGERRLLDPGLARMMRERHLATPPLARPSARGLGFGIFDAADGRSSYGHDGQTFGSEALLRLVPEHDLAVIVCANAIPDGDEVTQALGDAVLGHWGLRSRRLPAPIADPGVDLRRYVGRYRNLGNTLEVSAADAGRLRVVNHSHSEGQEPDSDVSVLAPIGDDAFVDSAVSAPTRATRFADPGPDGRCQSCFSGRVAWRIGGDEPDTLAAT